MGREGNRSAVEGLFIENYEALNIVHQVWHGDQQFLVTDKGTEVLIKGSHPSHLEIVKNH